MAPRLLDALHTWQEGGVAVRELEQLVASAVSSLDLQQAEQAARRLYEQRVFADEMLYTMLHLLADRQSTSSR